MKTRIINYLGECDDLPALPDIIIRLEELFRNPDTGISQVSDLLVTEPVLAGRIIKLANSAYFGGGRREVQSLTTAVIRLGLREVRKLVYSVELSKVFVDHPYLKQREFWLHSLAVALFSQQVCKRIGFSRIDADAAYLAGLVHDIGIIVFAHVIPDEYTRFLEKALKEDIPLHAQENRAFGIDHAELGEIFIHSSWSLDESVEQAVGLHHFPFEADSGVRNISQIINVANGICNNQGVTNGLGVPYGRFAEGAWLELGLDLEESQTMFIEVEESLAKAEEMLSA